MNNSRDLAHAMSFAEECYGDKERLNEDLRVWGYLTRDETMSEMGARRKLSQKKMRKKAEER